MLTFVPRSERKVIYCINILFLSINALSLLLHSPARNSITRQDTNAQIAPLLQQWSQQQ